jgi:very-short-patch-repair endonuclease
VSEPFDRISDWAAQMARDYVEQWRDDYGKLTESPIEVSFLLAFLATLYTYGEPYLVVKEAAIAEMALARNSRITIIRPQAQIEAYRVDFLVTYRLWDGIDPGDRIDASIVIECDGHDFHEKTKEQASKDKARDRRLQMLGCRVFRFSGSDLYQRPIDCAQEVYEFCDGLKWPPRRPQP